MAILRDPVLVDIENWPSSRDETVQTLLKERRLHLDTGFQRRKSRIAIRKLN